MKFRPKTRTVVARRVTHPEYIQVAGGQLPVTPGQWIIGETRDERHILDDKLFRLEYNAEDEEARQELLV